MISDPQLVVEFEFADGSRTSVNVSCAIEDAHTAYLAQFKAFGPPTAEEMTVARVKVTAFHQEIAAFLTRSPLG